MNRTLNKDILSMVTILIKIQRSGYGVFADWSGHVKWFDIRITKNHKEFDDVIYESHYIGSSFGHTVRHELELLTKFCNEKGIELKGICL